MKRAILFSLTLLFIFFGVALAGQAAYEEPYAGAVLCLPGVYDTPPADCLPLGPSLYLKRMADMGITLPFTKLEYEHPDAALAYVPYLYGVVVTENAPLFANKEDAAKGKPVLRRMENGFNYVSYTHTEMYKEVRVYMIAPGLWMNANNMHRIGPPSFQGILLTRTPRNPFGWVLQNVETKASPGYKGQDYTGNWLTRLDIVPVLGGETVDGEEWVMVRPGEWVHKVMIGRVYPRSGPPNGVEGNRWVDINLYEQTIAVYENNRLVFATVISSGVEPFWTRPGLFQVYEKLETTPMTGSFEADRSDYYSLEDVPWTMYFDEARALHGAYWHTFYGYSRSHGCVNLSPGDAHWLFNWAELGDWIYVWDPSGETPTDPSLYGSGGA